MNSYPDEIESKWSKTCKEAKAEISDFLSLNGYRQQKTRTSSERQVKLFEHTEGTDVVLIISNNDRTDYNFTLEIKSTNAIHESCIHAIQEANTKANELAQAYKEYDLYNELAGNTDNKR